MPEEGAEILRLAVIEKYRCPGVGGRLVRQFLVGAKKNGCQSVYQDVRESDDAAIHRYALPVGFASLEDRKDTTGTPSRMLY